MNITTKDRKKTLNKVRAILAATSAPWPIYSFSTSPRVHKAFLVAAPVVFVSMLLSAILVGTLIAAAVFGVVWKLTPPETWVERFCKLLADYQPLDEASYQTLLAKIKAGTADRDAIVTWLNAEAAHVERPGEMAAERALLNTRLK